MTQLSRQERADELQWIAGLVCAVGCALCLCGRDDLGLVAFVVALLVWLVS